MRDIALRHSTFLLLTWMSSLAMDAAPVMAADTEVAISVLPYYTSNAFGLKDDWIDGFSLQQGPGQRFEGLSSPWDFVTPIHAETSRRWKHSNGLRFTAMGSFEYEHYLQNNLASFGEFRVGGEMEAGKNARTRFRIDWTPNRYKKNYENPDLASDEYSQAEYRQLELSLAHVQRLHKSWFLQLSLDHDIRRFDDPFDNRDRNLWVGALKVEHALGKRLSLEFASELGTASSPGGIEEGLVVDRSFDQLGLSSALSSPVGLWRARVFAGLKLRDYTTDNDADLSRYDRRDRTWEISTKWDRRLGAREKLSLRLAYLDRSSDRPADLNDPDIVPYHETVLGVGLTHQF